MIFYFSATGNSEYVAKRIAAATGDRTISVTDCVKNGTYTFTPGKGEKIGLVTPTYAWGLPVIVSGFAQKLQLDASEKPYFFLVATYGTTPGQTGHFAQKCLRPNGIALTARFSVKMPDTWTPTFDLSDKDRVTGINRAAEPQIDSIIRSVSENATGDFMKNKVPKPAAVAFYALSYDSMRKTKHLKVDGSCIGCGLCAANCPAAAIEMRERKPVWVKDKCVMCLGCLHNCPKFAISYGKNTAKHGQYRHGKFI